MNETPSKKAIAKLLVESAKAINIEKSKNNFLHFVLNTKADYNLNWHHRIMCEKLDRFAKGEIKRLMIFVHPRAGKSELVSRMLPAYILGLHPDRKVISASYADTLASSMNRDVQRIMETEEYRTIFSESIIPDFGEVSKYLRNNDTFEIINNIGSYRCCGVGGSLTGYGADYGILDDVIKNWEQASSQTYRDKLWEWYQTTFLTRLEKNNSILLTVTRWHEDDLAGRLLDLAKNDPEADQWEVVSFQAIKESEYAEYDNRKIGEALWPYKFDLERLNKIRKDIGTKFWNSLYQQTPSAMEGNIIKRHWWKFYKYLPDGLEINQSWDLTFDETEKGSFVVGEVWGSRLDEHYLIDVFRERCGFTDQLRMVKTAKALYPSTRRLFVERKANGAALINTLQKEIAGIIPCEPQGSKTMRMESQAPVIESGNVYLPEGKSWVNDFIEEHTNFPNAKNDDQVDSTSQYLFNKRNAKSPLRVTAM